MLIYHFLTFEQIKTIVRIWIVVTWMNWCYVDSIVTFGLLHDLNNHLLSLRHVARTTNFDVSTGNDNAWKISF